MDTINKPAHYNQGSIECIEAMQQILTPEEYRGFLKGNVFKYLWREKDKNGIEDLRKGKDYYDRLIEHCDESLLDANKGLVKAWTCENGKAKQVYPEQPQPPDGYRWLEIGEVIRKGDKYRDLKSQTWIECVCSVGDSLQDFHKPTIRRNRFEVGEKVVAKDSHEIWEVDSLVNGVYQLRKDQTFFGSYPEHLAPYIEETT